MDLRVLEEAVVATLSADALGLGYRMKYIAIVFVRQTGAHGAGHVGWAFDCGDGTFNTGSVENPAHTLYTAPQKMGFWTIRTRDPIVPMRKRAYNAFKVIDLADGNPTYAWQVVAWASRKPYDIFGCNCMNVTYDVLRAFGVPYLPVPAHHWEPNHWFNHVQGQLYQIDADGVALESDRGGQAPVSLELPDIDSLLTDPLDNIEPAVPPWRTAHTVEQAEFETAMASAPAMPETQGHRTLLTYPKIIDKIRSLLGIDQERG